MCSLHPPTPPTVLNNKFPQQSKGHGQGHGRVLVRVAPAAAARFTWVAGNTMSHHWAEVPPRPTANLTSSPHALPGERRAGRGPVGQEAHRPGVTAAARLALPPLKGYRSPPRLSFLGPSLDRKVSRGPPTHVSGSEPLRPDKAPGHTAVPWDSPPVVPSHIKS